MNKMVKLAVTAGLLLAGSLMLPGRVLAADPLSADEFDELLDSFLVGEPDLNLVDVDQLEAEIEAGLPQTDSVFLRSGVLSALAKVLHALDIHDGELERVRYALGIRRVFVEEPPASDPVPVLLIAAHRVNLGQEIRQELIDSLGADSVGEPEEFGVGPHVEWRFVTRQLMGHEALLLAASRRDLSPEDVAMAGCLGGDCLNTAPLIDAAAVWHDFFPADLGFTVREFLDGLPYDAETEEGMPTGAAALDLAARLAGYDPYLAEQPVTYAALEINLGQEASLDAVIVQSDLADDSLASIWTRVYGFDTGAAEFALLGAQAYGCRRGDAEFAPVGEFCP